MCVKNMNRLPGHRVNYRCKTRAALAQTKHTRNFYYTGKKLHNCTRYDCCINLYLISISICNKYDCMTQSGTVCCISMKQNEATFWFIYVPE